MEPLSLFFTCIFSIYNKDIPHHLLPNSIQTHVQIYFALHYLLEVDETVYTSVVVVQALLYVFLSCGFHYGC